MSPRSDQYRHSQRGGDDKRTYHNPIPNGIHNLLQSVQAGNSAIHLAASVIADDDSVTANLHSVSGVPDALNTLQQEGFTAGDALPFFDEPLGLLPRMSVAVPDQKDKISQNDMATKAALKDLPNILIHPLSPNLLRMLLQIQPSLFAPLQKQRIIQSDPTSSVLMIKGIITEMHTMMPPSKLSCIRRQHASREPTVMSPLQHGKSLLIIRALIKLEEPRPVLVRGADFFDAVAPSRRQGVR
jgi:hypothetical protein